MDFVFSLSLYVGSDIRDMASDVLCGQFLLSVYDCGSGWKDGDKEY